MSVKTWSGYPDVLVFYILVYELLNYNRGEGDILTRSKCVTFSLRSIVTHNELFSIGLPDTPSQVDWLIQVSFFLCCGNSVARTPRDTLHLVAYR